MNTCLLKNELNCVFIPKCGIWLSFQEAKKWALMCFSESLLTVPFVSWPHRLLFDDSQLTETQRAIHPLSEQNVTSVAFQSFKNHRLLKGSILWLWSPLVCSLVIILRRSCKEFAGITVGFPWWAANSISNYILWHFMKRISFSETRFPVN